METNLSQQNARKKQTSTRFVLLLKASIFEEKRRKDTHDELRSKQTWISNVLGSRKFYDTNKVNLATAASFHRTYKQNKKRTHRERERDRILDVYFQWNGFRLLWYDTNNSKNIHDTNEDILNWMNLLMIEVSQFWQTETERQITTKHHNKSNRKHDSNYVFHEQSEDFLLSDSIDRSKIHNWANFEWFVFSCSNSSLKMFLFTLN